jgi:hypothetical protein
MYTTVYNYFQFIIIYMLHQKLFGQNIFLLFVYLIITVPTVISLLRLLHTMNVRFSLLDIAQRILGVTLPNFQ